MSTRERIRTGGVAPGTSRAPEPAPVSDPSLREDLEAVWSVGAADGGGAAVDALLTFAAAMISGADADEVVALVSDLAVMSDAATRRALFRDASRRLALSDQAPPDVIAAQVRLLVALAPVSAASVWAPTAVGGLKAVAAEGPFALTRGCRRIAAAVLDGDDSFPQGATRVRLHGYPLRGAALVVRIAADAYPDALPFLEELAFSFSSVLERDRLVRSGNVDGRRLEQAYERRLVRTAFDLHDGPLQDLAALAAEVRLLRSQVQLTDELRRELLVGRIDDVTARLAELDHSLRAITQSLETSTLAERPLADALRREIDAFARRSSVVVDVSVSGKLDELTMSQRIAVVRIVQEALSNIREHSGATRIEVAVRATGTRLTLRVRDNGNGFDVRETATAAARRGRLGIVGMAERVRLLGGVFTIDSVPGAGTTVSASIPAWRPLV